jgi:hypothetical protein
VDKIMANSKKIRVKEHRWPNGRGIGSTNDQCEARTYEIDENATMPTNAFAVADDAELHDWREEK